ncbi:MAG TPA: hypothetical protein VK969_10430 [Acidimicrobiia bacterium]|nr:hypothetical protein [Acidimicrobiia bacterium]
MRADTNPVGFRLRTARRHLDGVVRMVEDDRYASTHRACRKRWLFRPDSEIEAALAEREMNLMSIMIDPDPMVAAEAARFGIEAPVLIDTGQMSRDYGMVGVYGQADRPRLGFALVRQDGSIGWVRHYAKMFVPSGAFLFELDAALES